MKAKENKNKIKASVFLSPEENADIKTIAYKDRRSMAYHFELAIKEYIERNRERFNLRQMTNSMTN